MRGWPPSIARSVTPKPVCICVCAYRLFSTTWAIASRFSSMTIRMPSRLDSSRRSLIPSSRFSRTRSAICSTSFALFTWYGISVTTIVSRSVFGWTSTEARARTWIVPRPFS